MSVWEICLIGALSAVDGLFAGFAFGLREVKVRGIKLFLSTFWTAPMACLAVVAARVMGQFIPPLAARSLGGGLLMAAGVLSLLESLRGKKPQEPLTKVGALMLGLGLALDGSVAAFSLGLQGAAVLETALIFALLQFGFFITGNFLGCLRKQTGKAVEYAPSVVLMLLGLWKLLPIG